MTNEALGLIEVLGLTTALRAADSALKAADVVLESYEKIIGVGQCISVTLCLRGEVAAVKAAVEAANTAAGRVGTFVSSRVIPRPHDETEKLPSRFTLV